MKILDIMKDTRSNCFSIMMKISIKEYLDIIKPSYQKTGNIEGQRTPINSKTGKKIRDIMMEDIRRGAILPPIVLGVVTKNEIIKKISSYMDNYDSICMDDIINNKSLSIIDGIQRSTALYDVTSKYNDIYNKDVRVEVWITNEPSNLIYRMLVLNTGQISWSLKKQLEVVFSHVEDKMKENIPDIKIFNSNENKRSTGPGEYQLSHIVELYLAFSTRKENVDLSKEVAERFAKLDIIDLSSNFNYLEYFVNIMERIVKLDNILSSERIEKRIFGNQYARIALIVSMSKYVFGKPSVIREKDKVEDSYKKIIKSIDELINKLENMEDEELKEFCALDVFNEVTEDMGKLALIDFYKDSFNDLVNSDFEVDSLEECWRA